MTMIWIDYQRKYFAAYHAKDVDRIADMTADNPTFAMYCETDIAEGRLPAATVIRPRGRPATGKKGGSRWIYISDGDWQALQALGSGSASAGIRKLLEKETGETL
jgi:hypothetical protein